MDIEDHLTAIFKYIDKKKMFFAVQLTCKQWREISSKLYPEPRSIFFNFQLKPNKYQPSGHMNYTPCNFDYSVMKFHKPYYENILDFRF